MPGSSQWSLTLRFPHQKPVYISPLPHTRYIPRPFNYSRFYHPYNIGWAVHIIELLFMTFLHFKRLLKYKFFQQSEFMVAFCVWFGEVLWCYEGLFMLEKSANQPSVDLVLRQQRCKYSGRTLLSLVTAFDITLSKLVRTQVPSGVTAFN
jgi:hypothetical protein